MRLRLQFGFVFFIIFTLSSCVSKKQLGTTNVGKTIQQSSYLFEIPAEKTFPDWLKIKSELTLDIAGEKNTLDAQFRMKQNEVIWISLSKISFPIGKLYLTPDSVFMLDMFHKKYLKGSYDELSEKLGSKVNFSLFQNIILGQILKDENEKFFWFSDNQLQLSSAPHDSIKSDSIASVSYLNPYSIQSIDTNSRLLTGYFSAIPAQNENLKILFSKRDTTIQFPLPIDVTITVFKNSVLKMICNLAHQKVEFLSELKTPFEIPDNYAKME